MTRTILFQIHWFLGITAGLVLAAMGLTGASLSFEHEIMRVLSPGIVTLAPGSAPALSPDAVIARASAGRGGLRVERLTVEADPARAWQVQFTAEPGQRRGERSYVDPRSGRLLGQPVGAGFFRTMEDIHRWLALPGGSKGWGRQITGFSTIALIFFALSGLYLRWPRRALDWRAWLVLDWRKSGRNLYRELHVIIGSWVVIAYLLSAFTGLWWSYEWYREGALVVLTGSAEREGDHGGKPDDAAPQPALPLAAAWQTLLRETGGRFDSVSVSLPETGTKATFRVLLAGARHDRMTDNIDIDLADGRVGKADRYADRALGKVVATSMFEVHRGAIFGLPGRLVIFVTSLAMPLFTVTGLLLYIARRRRKRALAQVEGLAGSGDTGNGDMLVAYASQTGGAERLARQTAAVMGGAKVLPLSSVDGSVLAETRRALFVVSTYGEGEPPDRARRFARETMASPLAVEDLDYAVLALGDREYPQFCAFGHEVDRWLHAGGGRRLFDTIEVDGEDVDAERQWQQQLTALGADPMAADFAPARYARWRLAARSLLNPGSLGGPAFLIALEPLEDAPHDWKAGDIAEIRPCNDPAAVSALLHSTALNGTQEVHSRTLAAHLGESVLPETLGGSAEEIVATLRPLPHREYSIASIPGDGRIELIVRQVRRDDGTLGLGSGWLTAHAPLGTEIALRLHGNPGFRVPDDHGKLILIGNGTGLAGLRGHLRQAAAAGVGGHWLMLGERSRASDAFLDEELQGWLADGTLAQLDRTWSRDPDCGRYVQDLIPQSASFLRAAVGDGATILVCGSLLGMAPAVDAALRAVLGDALLEQMAESGHYLRDIY
ncbi:PepSY domain-containing protein [Novosphingobium guangzhouense]|uniref:Sulfite reductase subunit alpha n=1 Tax=Novosphingobium guangzhouense TaxID=1850347 RepID=A0A2K2FZR9_9SPHN|nr:sulfite reductase flavoprotein subunit alpha [Novosphingobium guangzhouense]PNU04248.1 sulfite reductase subunit alpha [Novosphingobium guangzhouense]